MVYTAMNLNGDIASGRPGAASYRAGFRLERIDFPTCEDGGDRGVHVPQRTPNNSNYLHPALSGFDVVTSTVIFVNYYEVL